MRNRFWRAPDFRLRDVIVVLTLVSHLMVTFGFPLPAPGRKSKDASRPYPCQNRPCGCFSAEQCWAGDCCCFTLEEKLAWADANGVEPPAQVRPQVESRKANPTPPKKKPCCCEAGAEEGTQPTESPSCCPKADGEATPSCCGQSTGCCDRPSPECPACAAKTSAKCCEKKAPPAGDESGVRWVVGIFARKCRGEGPAGLMKLDPSVPPDMEPRQVVAPEPGEFLAGFDPVVTSASHSPPTRPPRGS
jgi:hypothetical protein